MYFSKFPQIIYDFDISGNDTALYVTDITRNIRFRRDILSNITIFDEYDIIDGETPEIIAEKIYGNSLYHWIVMLSNDRYDYLNDFPLPTNTLEKYIAAKYTNPYGIHHYVDENGFICDATFPGATSVSNYQYESDVNESKRRIKIIPREIVDKILTEYRDLM